MRILIVDPDEDQRSLFAIWLSKAGHTVTAAPGMRGARSAAEAARFDVVVTEVWFGGRPDGFLLVDALCAATPGLHVVLTAGSLEPGLSVRQLLVLYKPFARQTLLDAVVVPDEPPGARAATPAR